VTLTRLELAQFRSWPRLGLDLDDRPLAIFGPNGAGKTNILEALSMLSPGRGLRNAAPGDQARQGPDAGWRIRAVIGDHQVETGASPGESRKLTIDEKPAPQVALGRLVRLIWVTPAMDRLWTDPPESRRRFLDRLTLSLIPSHAETALAYERAMRERNRLLRDEIRDELEDELRDEIKEELQEELGDEIIEELKDELREEIADELKNELRENINAALRNKDRGEKADSGR